MSRNKIIVAVIIVGLFGVVMAQRTGVFVSNSEGISAPDKKVTVFKSPTCGCCGKYINHLEKNGYDVETVMTNDMESIKAEHSIPGSMESCHTMIIDDYFVEGHVPLVAVDKLLEEKPDVDGIALPGMPSGSPGMPGPQTEPFNVFTVTDGQASSWLQIN